MSEDRNCPDCGTLVKGQQKGSDPYWYRFVCVPCEEDWLENIKYCTPEAFSEGQQ